MAVAEATGRTAGGLAGKRLPFEAIPIVDFGPFLTGDAATRRRVAKEIGRASAEVGFFYIRNHGVAESLIDTTLAEAKRFFDQPLARKLDIAMTKSKYHRGYYGMGDENLDPKKQKAGGDLKEGINIGRDLPLDDPDVKAGKPLHGPNQWPDLPGWREQMIKHFYVMQELGSKLLAAFALSLDLPEDFFADKITKPLTTLRLVHYPPQTGPISEAQLGAGAHTDFGCFTMVWQDDVGGLQVKNSAGEFIDAVPIPGSFVVNIGDMLARWTNDRFASTTHRVINTSGRERYSMAFFFDPNFDVDVSCLPTCLNPGETPHYPPTSGGQHLLDRIAETFEYRTKQG
jgi:isopenicillin N synthase-like dioxygenase